MNRLTFLPALADLLGTNPLGDWTLTVGDYGRNDTGTLDEWSLSMTIYLPSGTAQTAQTVQPVQAGRTEPVRLSLLGEAPLGTGETLTVDFAYAPQGGGVGGGVSISSPDSVRFTESSTIADLTLSAATNALEGTLTATVSDALPGMLIAPADLLVEILPREYTLSFMTSDGAPLASVLTGGTVPVRLSLLGEVALNAEEAETLTVDFEYDVLGVSVSSPDPVHFTEGSTLAELTLSAAADASSGILTATVSSTLLNMSPIAPADLSVDVQALREYTLAFPSVFEENGVFESRSSGTPIPEYTGTGTQSVRDVIAVPVDGVVRSLSVDVSITHPHRGDLWVTLISPSGRAVTLHNRAGGNEDHLRVTYDLANVPALADLLGMNSQGDWTLTVGDYAFTARGTLDAWSLRMMVHFSFQAGGTAPVRLSLLGVIPLGMNEEVTVDLAYAPEDGGGLVSSPAQVRFTRNNTVDDLTLKAARGGRSGTLTATVSSTMPNMLPQALPIAPADLSVEIVPREYELVFTTLDGVVPGTQQVQANGTARIRLSLLGETPLFADETLTVDFEYGVRHVGHLSISTPDTVRFRPGSTAVDLTLSASLRLTSGPLIATVSGVVGAVVRQKQVWVVVVPREYALAFTMPNGEALDTLRVPAGAITQTPVSLSLSGVAPLGRDETLEVDFTYDPQGGGEGGGVSVSSPGTVSFRPGSTEVDLTVDTTAAAETGTLTAKVKTPSITIASSPTTTLQVEIVPREYALEFTTADGEALETLQMPVGGTTQVRLSLSGEAPLGGMETLTVSFAYGPPGDGGDVVSVSSPGTIRFTMNSTVIDLTLNAPIEARSGTLTASIGDAVNAIITPTSLPVELVRGFILVFTTPGGDPLARARVLAGDSTGVMLTLYNPDLLSDNESVEITLSTRTVSISEVSLTLTQDSPSTSLMIRAAHDAVSPDARVSVVSARLVQGNEPLENLPMEGLPSLAVEIVSRRFRVEVARGRVLNYQSPGSLTLPAGIRTDSSIVIPVAGLVESLSVSVSITHGNRANLTVGLISPLGRELVLFTPGGAFTLPPNLRRTFQVEGLEGVEVLGTWTLTVDNSFSSGRLDSWSVQVTLQEADATESVQIFAAGTVDMVARLVSVESALGTPTLMAGEILDVGFGYDSAGVTLSPVEFDSGSTAARAILNATPEATSGTLLASLRQPRPNVAIDPLVSLPIEIVPRAFSLTFANLFVDSRSPDALIAFTGTIGEEGAPNAGAKIRGEVPRYVIPVRFDGIVKKASVFISLTHQSERELQVELFSPDGTKRVIHQKTNTRTPPISGTYDVTSYFQGKSVRGDWALAIDDFTVDFESRPGGIVAVDLTGTLHEWSLMLELETPLLSALASGSRQTQLLLSGVPVPAVGVPSLGPGEVLPISLMYRGTGVTLTPLEVSGSVQPVTVLAEAQATPGTLTAIPGSLPNTLPIPPASILVAILPREFVLGFVTPLGEPLEMVQMVAGDVLPVRLILSDDVSGDVSLDEGESLAIELIDETGVTIASSGDAVFTPGNRTIDLTLSATVAAQPSTVMARVSSTLPNLVPIPSPALMVEILPREFTLAFTTLAGEPLGAIQLEAGATTQVRLALSGRSLLGEDEILTASLISSLIEGGEASSVVLLLEPANFAAASTALTLTVSAPVDALPTLITASIEDALNVKDVEVSAEVEILPREFTLAFTAVDGAALDMVQMQAGATTRVRLSLSGEASLGMDETLTVSFVYAAEDGSTGADVAVQDSVGFTATSGNVIDLTLNALVVARSGMLTASIGDAVNVMILPTSLQVEIVLRKFTLMFTTLDDAPLAMARVQAGATTQVRLSLSGEASLGADETLTVSFVYIAEDGSTGADVTVQESVGFTDTSGNAIDLTLTAAATARPGALMARIEDAVSTMITPSSLPVEILPREFTLTFTTLDDAPLATARVQAGATTQVRLSLSGDGSLGEDEMLTVSFDYEPQADGVTVSSPPPVVFTADGNAIDLTLNAPIAARPGVLTARIEDAVNAIIAPTSLQVRILREYALAFTTLDGASLETARVRAGAMTRVRLSLLSGAPLGADETLTVSFVYEPQANGMAGDVTVSSPPRVVFTESRRTVDLTLNATAMAQPGTLTAKIEDVVDATIPPTSLQTEILPREFTLAFTPPEVGIVPGSTRAVTLTLGNAAQLEAEEQVPVVLTLSEGSSLTLSSTEFTFGRDVATHVVDLGVPAGAPAGSGTLRATVSASHGLVNVDFAPAEVQVNVIDNRIFAWAFRSVETGEALSTAVAAAGGSRGILLSLESDQGALLAAGESVGVSLSLVGGNGITVTPPALTFTSTAPRGSLTLQAESTATPGQLVVMVTGTTPDPLPDATVAPPPALPVMVVREFTLAFTTLDDAPLITAQVQAGATTRVSLSLSGAAPLGMDETLTVTFSYDPVDGGVSVSSPTQASFVEGSTTIDLTLNAAANAQSGALTANVSGTSLDTLPIAPMSLPVEILPREFVLMFTTLDDAPLETARVQAGATMRVRLSLSGEASLGENETLTVSFVYAAESGGTDADVTVLESVSFSITSGNAIDLTLNAPTAARSGALMASIEDAVNAMIPPTSLQVEIVPREFTLAFTTSADAPLETARVQAAATTRVRLSLSGDGSLGADETLTVSFVYAAENGSTSTDVTVQESVDFTATSGNVIDLTLNAAAAAQPGALTASIEDAVNAIITPASLSMEILTRGFTLAFTTLDDAPLETARVQAGATTQVRLSLSSDGSLGADETLTVSFVYEPSGGGTGADVTVQESVGFTATSGNVIDLTLNAPVAARPGALTASVADALPNVRAIVPVSLPVEILSREFALTFTALDDALLETVRVQANATARVRLSLSGDGSLGADETLTVSFVYEPSGGGTGADVTVQESVSFTTASGTAINLTLNALAAAQPGALTASIEDAVNAIITPASLQVEILPREFALAFTTSDDAPLETAQVQAGAAMQVRLSLSGDGSLGADETLTVSFVYAAENGSTSTDVTVQESVDFTATSGNAIDLTLNAAGAAQPGTLTANIEDAMNAIITPASLQVEILTREFTLAFTTLDGAAPETVQVPAGAATRVRLTLSGATPETLLGTDEMLTVSFIYAAEGDGTAADVTVQGSVSFTATSGSLITLTLSAPRAAQPGTGTLTASIEAAVNATITPASLSVEIVPAEAVRLQVRVLLEGALQ